jgi:hypothetical protein
METTTIISAIAASLAALVAVLTLIIQCHQNRKNEKKSLSEKAENMLEKTRTDPGIMHFMKAIDYGKSWYKTGFHESNFEKSADDALLTYNYILWLKERNLLDENGLANFLYEIDKIVGNKDVQCYFFNLYHYSQKAKLPFKFEKLMQYGVEKHYIDKDIYNEDSENFGEQQLEF